MSVGKFGLRIIYRDGHKNLEWFIEKNLRDAEYKRYKRSPAVFRVTRVSR